MFGVAINGLSIFFGALAGIALKKILNQYMIKNLFQVMGIVIIIISIVGIVTNTIKISHNALEVNNLIIVTSCLILGTLIGEFAKLDSCVNKFGYSLEQRYNVSGLIQGLLSSSIFFGVGALQIIGPIASFTQKDISILITKSLVDFPFAVAFGALFGIGVVCSAVPVALGQIIIGSLSVLLSSFVNQQIIILLNSVGYIILFCSGLNMTFDKIIEIKTVNLMPSVFVIIIAGVIMSMLGV